MIEVTTFRKYDFDFHGDWVVTFSLDQGEGGINTSMTIDLAEIIPRSYLETPEGDAYAKLELEHIATAWQSFTRWLDPRFIEGHSQVGPE